MMHVVLTYYVALLIMCPDRDSVLNEGLLIVWVNCAIITLKEKRLKDGNCTNMYGPSKAIETNQLLNSFFLIIYLINLISPLNYLSMPATW